MRWLVEVVSLGKTETESLYVDADSWQRALQAARAERGESAPMSGFSIELLEEGCRAVDPTARLRYDIKRAPVDGGTPRAPSVRPAVEPGADGGVGQGSAPRPVPTPPRPASIPAPSVSPPPRGTNSPSKRPPLSAATLSAVMGPVGSASQAAASPGGSPSLADPPPAASSTASGATAIGSV